MAAELVGTEFGSRVEVPVRVVRPRPDDAEAALDPARRAASIAVIGAAALLALAPVVVAAAAIAAPTSLDRFAAGLVAGAATLAVVAAARIPAAAILALAMARKRDEL